MPKQSKSPRGRPRSGTSPDREQRWDEIIEAAASIFFKKGYEAASLQDIATAVGLLKGSIYYYINTKEDLLYELVMRVQKVWHETITETEEVAHADAPTRLREFILRWMQLHGRDREWGVVYDREYKRLSSDYLTEVNAERRHFPMYIESIIKQGIAEGHFDPELDLTVAAEMVIELMRASHRSRRPRANVGVVELADSYSLFVMRGLGATDWRPPPAG